MNNSDRSQQENSQTEFPVSLPTNVLAVKWSYRWEVFRRLRTLEVDCKCSTNEPLRVHLYSPKTLIQIWSVLRQFNLSRHESIDWLNSCWEMQSDCLNKYQ